MQDEITVEGSLNSNGDLVLSQRPDFPPGPVTVTLRRANSASKNLSNWFQLMTETRESMRDAGCRLMSEPELNAHIEWLREEDRIDELLGRIADQNSGNS